MNTWNRSCHAQFAFAVRNGLNRTAFEYDILSIIKTKRLVSVLFLVWIIDICSVKKITSWTQATSSRQHILERWISGYLTKGLHLSFASFWKSAQKKVSFFFFFFFFNFHNGICVSKFPSCEAIRKWQTDFSPGDASVCFCCPGEPCWEKESFWFYLVDKKNSFIYLKKRGANKWYTLFEPCRTAFPRTVCSYP